MVFILDFQNAQCDDVANFNNFLRVIHAAVTQLGNVNQTFEIPRNVQTRKSTETSQTSNFTFNQLTDLEVFDLL